MGVGLLSLLGSSVYPMVGKGVGCGFFSVGERGGETKEAMLPSDLDDAGDMGNGGSASKSCPSKSLVDLILDARELCPMV
jgi:hypothetical protein